MHSVAWRVGQRAAQKAESMAEMMADRWVALSAVQKAAYLALSWAGYLAA